MFLTLGALLFVMWLIGLATLQVTGGAIHLLLVLAVISLVLHFVRGRSVA